MRVVTDEDNTLLWIEWAWKSGAWQNPDEEYEEGGTQTQRVFGLVRLIQDLWRAKSLVLYANYYEFFDAWDSQRFFPFIEQLENLYG
jgi:hypothetical protein